MVDVLHDAKKDKIAIDISSLPDGLKELIAVPSGKPEDIAKRSEARDSGPRPPEPKLLQTNASSKAILLPAANAPPSHSDRPKTALEQELDALIAARQAIIESLKAKNPVVAEARKKIAALIPALRGKGATHTMKLVEEAERIEFSISTEAYTPKKEKDLIKHLRGIKAELSKHKELDGARLGVEAVRKELHSVMREIHSLERELNEARKKCEEKYSQVLAERKAGYESRQKKREEREIRHENERHKRFEDLKQRVRQEKRKEYDSELAPYMKKHDDTVSMDEIVQIEKKEKKSEADEEKSE